MLCAAQIPQAEISNRSIHARINLPDARNGSYRATRFDWSGVIASLESHGHSYFGQWFAQADPNVHDSITGPVEEFLTSGAGLGYADARPGETFFKIGVGALRKPDEPSYRQFHTYEILDSGHWTIRKGRDWIEFTQTLSSATGYSWIYRKRLRLAGNKLLLEHHLKNSGRKTIETSVYDHDFYMLDGQPTGPDTTIRFAFTPRAQAALGGLAEIQDNEIRYLQELQEGQTVETLLDGFSSSATGYDIRVENKKTGAGVRQTADRPLSKLNLWSIRTTVCPEAWLDLRIAPGSEASWRITYEFYSLRP